jgi:glycosyltransferase involved in cell wall biosynthesis
MLRIGINGRSMFRNMTGVQRYTHEITHALLRQRPADVSYQVFAGREARSAGTGLPLDTSFFPSDSPVRGLLWEQSLLKRMVKKAGIDVLFNPGNVAPLGPPVPSVITIHDLAFLLFPQYFSRAFRLYYRSAVPRMASEAAAIITDSQSSRLALEELLRIPSHKINVIPLGVSAEFRRRISREEIERVRSRYGLPEKFFLSLSSLEPRKNLHTVLAAYRLLPEDVVRDHKLVVVGAGNRVFADAGLSAAVSAMKPGTVILPGYVPSEDLPAIYRLSIALVFPSLYEGFGLPVLEAMAASTPVITSNRSSLPEVAGTAAVLVDPESREELAAAMELIATDSGTRNLLIERGKKRASGFTWEKSADLTLDVLRSAAG